MAGTRSTASGSFMFNLDGVPCGFVRSAEGGDAVGVVVEEGSKSGVFTKKHIGKVKYDAVELSFGFDMTPDIYEWIEASWKQNYSRKDGSIVVTEPNLQADSAREFYHALITEVTIPDLDANSKDAAHLTLKFAPEYTRDVKANGKVTVPKTPAQKQFTASSFQFELDELPGGKVSRIDSFTVTQPVVDDDVGSVRDAPTELGKIQFPNLRVTILEDDAGPWGDWAQDFLVKGNNDDSHEKRGAIVFLTPNRQVELARIGLLNVGIFAFRRAAGPAGNQVSHVVADLYCEQMEFLLAKRALEPVPAPPPRLTRVR
jgi:T4-like virus tail tube protein gp19